MALAAAVSILSFDDGDWPQLNGLLADSSIVAGVHHIRHVLIRLGGLRGGVKHCKNLLKV